MRWKCKKLDRQGEWVRKVSVFQRICDKTGTVFWFEIMRVYWSNFLGEFAWWQCPLCKDHYLEIK